MEAVTATAVVPVVYTQKISNQPSPASQPTYQPTNEHHHFYYKYFFIIITIP